MASPRRAAKAPHYWQNHMQPSDQHPESPKKSSRLRLRFPSLTSRLQLIVFMQIQGSLGGGGDCRQPTHCDTTERKTKRRRRVAKCGKTSRCLKAETLVTKHQHRPTADTLDCCIGVFFFSFKLKRLPSSLTRGKWEKPLNNYTSSRLPDLCVSRSSLRGSDLRWCGCDTDRRLTPRAAHLAKCSRDSESGRPDSEHRAYFWNAIIIYL